MSNNPCSSVKAVGAMHHKTKKASMFGYFCKTQAHRC
jgi:hypothetical protein